MMQTIGSARDDGDLRNVVITRNEQPAASLTISNSQLLVEVTVAWEPQRRVIPLRAEDYPAFAEIWDNDEDDHIFADLPPR